MKIFSTLIFLIVLCAAVVFSVMGFMEGGHVVQTEGVSVSSSDTLYEVVRVVDGDTIEVNVDGKRESVRLIGLDAPEMSGPYTEYECFSEESKQELTRLIQGKKVRLRSDTTQDDRDKYDRLLRYVILNDGTNVNEQLIRGGFAEEYTHIYAYTFQTMFRASQSAAQMERIGLWSPLACP